jgi:hypothetical protein
MPPEAWKISATFPVELPTPLDDAASEFSRDLAYLLAYQSVERPLIHRIQSDSGERHPSSGPLQWSSTDGRDAPATISSESDSAALAPLPKCPARVGAATTRTGPRVVKLSLTGRQLGGRFEVRAGIVGSLRP